VLGRSARRETSVEGDAVTFKKDELTAQQITCRREIPRKGELKHEHMIVGDRSMGGIAITYKEKLVYRERRTGKRKR